MERSKINELVKKNAFINAIIKEAKPIFNKNALEELKKIPFDPKPFIEFYKDSTKESIKSTKEMIELDKLEGGDVVSYSILYSLILRLRGVCVVNSIINNKIFTNRGFKKYLLKTVPNAEFSKIYSVYRRIRDNIKVKNIKIELKYAESLLNLLNKEISKW